MVSNSRRGASYEVALNQDGAPASEPVIIAQTGPVDDFYVDDGRIVFTTHGAALQAIGAMAPSRRYWPKDAMAVPLSLDAVTPTWS